MSDSNKDPDGMEPINPKELDALKFLCETNRSIHNSRISRELKLVFALIPFFIVSTSYMILTYSPKNFIEFLLLVLLLFLGYFVLFVAAFCYLHGSAKSNLRNQELAETAEDQIVRVLIGKGYTDFDRFENGFVPKTADGYYLKESEWHWWIPNRLLKALKTVVTSVLQSFLFGQRFYLKLEIANLKEALALLKAQKMYDEGKEGDKKYQPSKDRWLWYVNALGLTAFLSWVIVTLCGIIKLLK